MRKNHLFYLAGFAVHAKTRQKAIYKFVRLGFSRYLAEAETVQIRNGFPRPISMIGG